MDIRCFPDLVVDDVVACATFYRSFFDLVVVADQGWYVELADSDNNTVVAFTERGHPTLPDAVEAAGGVLVSFEVVNATAMAATAVERGIEIVRPLTREFGQLHFMMRDRHGLVVDVIERVELTREDVRQLAIFRRQRRTRAHVGP